MKHARPLIYSFIISAMLAGCASGQPRSDMAETTPNIQSLAETAETAPSVQSMAETVETAPSVQSLAEENGMEAKGAPETMAPAASLPSTLIRPDWSHYFDGQNGAAVIFDPDENQFQIYNENLADTRRPPCSTFKIISSLAGLESGVIDPEHSTRTWSGETFWNNDWNRDMDFSSAFRTSCVWYYRQVIDDIGPDAIQHILDRLQYGNCDASDWSGRLNTNNSNPALTGFWIESSLKISPKEQVQVMERIFGSSSEYPSHIRAILEEVMFFPEASLETCSIYGKTGMGKANGVVVDAWYTGFADVGRRIYFCVYLGESANQTASSALARDIAISLMKDHFQ